MDTPEDFYPSRHDFSHVIGLVVGAGIVYNLCNCRTAVSKGSSQFIFFNLEKSTKTILFFSESPISVTLLFEKLEIHDNHDLSVVSDLSKSKFSYYLVRIFLSPKFYSGI